MQPLYSQAREEVLETLLDPTKGLQVCEHSCSFLFSAVANSTACWGVLAARAPDYFRGLGTWSCCRSSHLLHLKGDQGCGCLDCEILELGPIQAGDNWVGPCNPLQRT